MKRDQDEIIAKLLDGSIRPEERAWLEEQMQRDETLRTFVDELRETQEIERYLENALSEEARDNFEKRLAASPSLQQAVAAYQSTKNLLALEQKQHYTQIFEKIGEERARQPRKKHRRYWYWLFPLVVLLGVGIAFLPQWGPGENSRGAEETSTPLSTDESNAPEEVTDKQEEQLIEQEEKTNETGPAPEEKTEEEREGNDEPEEEQQARPIAYNAAPPSLAELMDSKGEGIDEPLYQLWRPAYDAGDYPQVITVITGYGTAYPETIQHETTLVLGLAYFYTDQFEKAIEQFRKIQSLEYFTAVKEDAQWYLALAYLEDEQEETTQQLLEEITPFKNHKHYKSAMDLLQQLER